MIHKNEIQELELLKHVEESPRLTNRIAAQKLGCSIKLAHEVLKKMASRGLFHINKVHSRRWDYFLTPKGLAEKARLTMGFLNFSLYFYHEARKLSSQVCRDLAESGVTKVSFLGAGDLAEIVYLGVKEWGLEIEVVYDDDKNSFFGFEVNQIKNLSKHTHEVVLVCMYDPKHPTQQKFLPHALELNTSFHWIFS